MDLTAILGVAQSLKVAGDLTKAVVDLRDAQLVQSKVIELQSVILSAQSSAMLAQQEQFTLVERIRSLETEVADLKAWDTQADEYELKQIDRAAFAYMKKEAMRGPEPAHWLCVNCFEHKRRSVLQDQGRSKADAQMEVFGCPTCRATLMVHWRRKPSEPYQTA